MPHTAPGVDPHIVVEDICKWLTPPLYGSFADSTDWTRESRYNAAMMAYLITPRPAMAAKSAPTPKRDPAHKRGQGANAGAKRRPPGPDSGPPNWCYSRVSLTTKEDSCKFDPGCIMDHSCTNPACQDEHMLKHCPLKTTEAAALEVDAERRQQYGRVTRGAGRKRRS
jgi:hypothetical protein